MDYNAFFKDVDVILPKVLEKSTVQALYDEQVETFVETFKELYPDMKLWRHGYRHNPYLFWVDGDTNEFEIRVARFKIFDGLGKGTTFTFYGTLFVAGSKFSRQFMQCSVSCASPESAAKNEVNSRTRTKWRKARHVLSLKLRTSRCLSIQGRSSACSLSYAIAFLLMERHRVPFWHLS